MYDQCATLKVPFSGNAAGRNSTTNLLGVTLGPYPEVLGWQPKGIGALAGSILCALLGMLSVVWYSFGDQLDAEEVEAEVIAALKAKKERGTKTQRFKKMVAKMRAD